jgi:hypothetical protein
MKQVVATQGQDSAARRVNRFPMRDAQTGQFLTVTEATRTTVPKHIGRGYALSKDSMELVLGALHAATTKSRSAGTALQFIVEVKPNGTPRIVEALGDATGHAQARGALEIDAEEEAELEQALGEARERGRHLVAQILVGDDMLSADAFADHLQTTRATINAWRQSHQVLGLQGATRGYRYPVWQIGADGRPFAALPKLFENLTGGPWTVYRFLTQHHDALDGLTGLEALQHGREAAAIEAASGIAQATFA